MPEITFRGVRFHVETVPPPDPAPDAPPVVFLHGLLVDNLSGWYCTLAGPVAAAGGHCVLYDLRGHGMSQRPDTGYTLQDGVADLFGVLDGLGLHGPAFLAANGFGGVIALHAALERPERVAGLVLVEVDGTAADPLSWREDLLTTLSRSALSLEYDNVAGVLTRLGRRGLVAQQAAASALLDGTSLLADLAAARPVPPSDLERLTCPVLAVYGEQSALADTGRLLQRQVRDCTLHLVPGQAHTILVDGATDLLQAILPWLARHAGVRSEAVA